MFSSYDVEGGDVICRQDPVEKLNQYGFPYWKRKMIIIVSGNDSGIAALAADWVFNTTLELLQVGEKDPLPLMRRAVVGALESSSPRSALRDLFADVLGGYSGIKANTPLRVQYLILRGVLEIISLGGMPKRGRPAWMPSLDPGDYPSREEVLRKLHEEKLRRAENRHRVKYLNTFD